MIWISIILGIIEAIPSLINVIQEIVAAIDNHPLQVRHQGELFSVLARWHGDKDGDRLKIDLAKLHTHVLAT